MSVISYAQNFEDVMLWRALKHINKGFYIDVGAYSPFTDSVTKLFYDKGWHGINIEPNPQLLPAFQLNRPHDINLQVAVGDKRTILAFTILEDAGLSTFDSNLAASFTHANPNWKVQKIDIPVLTIQEIWNKHILPDQEVHFLKVDVEGYEKKVIQGNDWNKYRPWILVLEATVPMSQKENYQEWEPLLLGANYIFAYADGLNRFYIAQEHSELIESFKYPPNVFDEIIPARLWEIKSRASKAEQQVQELTTQQLKAEQRMVYAEERAQNAEKRAESAENRTQKVEERKDCVLCKVDELQKQLESTRDQEQKTIILNENLKKELWIAEQKATDAIRHTQEAETQKQIAEHKASQAATDAQEAERKAANAEIRAQAAEAMLQNVYRSRCWRMTAPYRYVGDKTRNGILHTKNLLKKCLRKLAPFVMRTPFLKKSAQSLLSPFPMLKMRIKRAANINQSHYFNTAPIEPVTEDLSGLSPRALEIYNMLVKAQSNKEGTR